MIHRSGREANVGFQWVEIFLLKPLARRVSPAVLGFLPAYFQYAKRFCQLPTAFINTHSLTRLLRFSFRLRSAGGPRDTYARQINALILLVEYRLNAVSRKYNRKPCW